MNYEQPSKTDDLRVKVGNATTLIRTPTGRTVTYDGPVWASGSGQMYVFYQNYPYRVTFGEDGVFYAVA